MRFYQTITILPDALISAVFLRQQIWRQLHLILAENKTGENSSAVAVAFPDYCRKPQTPGNRLRLLAGDYPSLAELGLSVRLAAFYPYIRLSGILPVPEKTLPVSYIREHVKGLRRSQTAGAGRLFIPETLPLSGRNRCQEADITGHFLFLSGNWMQNLPQKDGLPVTD